MSYGILCEYQILLFLAKVMIRIILSMLKISTSGNPGTSSRPCARWG
jgi:hypothetical protein